MPKPFRVLLTLFIGALSLLPAHIALPFVELHAFGEIGASPQLSIGALGLGPIFSAFILVQLVAAVIPSLASLRTSARRADFERIVRRLAMVLAFIQAAGMVRYLQTITFRGESIVAGGGSEVWLVLGATLIAGACLPIAFAELIDRAGVGSGYSILLAAQALANLPALAHEYSERALNGDEFQLVFGVVVVLGGSVLLLKKKGPLHLPTSGLHPIHYAASTFALLVMTGKLDLLTAAVPQQHQSHAIIALRTVTVLLFCALFSKLHNLRATPEQRRALPAATAFSALFVGLFSVYVGLEPSLDLLGLVTLAAVLLDLAAELSFRSKHGAVLAIACAERPEEADELAHALAEKNIESMPQGIYIRALLQFFGPFVPIQLLVREENAEAARALLASPAQQEGEPSMQVG